MRLGAVRSTFLTAPISPSIALSPSPVLPRRTTPIPRSGMSYPRYRVLNLVILRSNGPTRRPQTFRGPYLHLSAPSRYSVRAFGVLQHPAFIFVSHPQALCSFRFPCLRSPSPNLPFFSLPLPLPSLSHREKIGAMRLPLDISP
ncbi:hypothetical protein DFP72DRAFT_886300 [Ephemerocybe angulata]|uniref:Uncharacterized protein n=1 Tax=Ephemerocybe angulata TaxID=980116 RepID=A0A8H6I894_9AGAR|nr:hypothetical protein DFP72DRAFT_886300 [Tulosesus angulatus]